MITTTTSTTRVMRIVSWRVGHTTLRSSNSDSETNSRPRRPAAVSAATAIAAGEAARDQQRAHRRRPWPNQ